MNRSCVRLIAQAVADLNRDLCRHPRLHAGLDVKAIEAGRVHHLFRVPASVCARSREGDTALELLENHVMIENPGAERKCLSNSEIVCAMWDLGKECSAE